MCRVYEQLITLSFGNQAFPMVRRAAAASCVHCASLQTGLRGCAQQWGAGQRACDPGTPWWVPAGAAQASGCVGT